ncbi:MAG: hypothetical protein PHS02_02610 [Candidatus ainarchaeum sp.]|nr:hypothetical protein [Candidatus ainarchaeum sp.]
MDLNEAWKSTCKIVFGEEIGELEEFGKYLGGNVLELGMRKSSISGQPVTLSSLNEICGSAKFISNDEVPAYQKATQDIQLDINQVKDIDSVLSALKEKFCYSGNVVLGNSNDVGLSDNCTDSSHVYKSQVVGDGCKYVAFSSQVRQTQYAFGVTYDGGSKFAIRGFCTYKLNRCFENLNTFDSSDCYFTAGLRSCSNCMFSFNLRNKNNAIGNLALQKDAYLALRKKLLAEITDELKRKKSMPGIIGLLTAPSHSLARQAKAQNLKNFYRGRPSGHVETAFENTCTVLFGKSLGRLVPFEKWLSRHVNGVVPSTSPLSGQPLYISAIPSFLALRGRVLGLEEAVELGKLHIPESALQDFSLSNAAEKLESIRYTTTEDIYGTNNLDMVECTDYGNNSAHAFRSSQAYVCKCVAYSFWPRNSEFIFGSKFAFYSKHCVNCYNSTNLSRCFEVSDSNNCSDCYFCHNSEGLSNCIFCFNAKSLRYAIGNKEIGRENYLKIKKIILDEMVKKLEKDKKLELDIYNIGCYKS